MNRLLKKMIDLIKEEHNAVNEKLTGILFLESFKFNFIPKLKNSIESLENYAEISEKDNFSLNNDEFKVSFFTEKKRNTTFSKKIDESTLLISVTGQLVIDIINQNSKNDHTKLKLHKFMGISLTKGSMINLSAADNSFYIEFLKIDERNDIENLKKDII
tara:strand:- start:151 stop:630 length:480 start_codon:yes stop_codon:yes gene_type:complete